MKSNEEIGITTIPTMRSATARLMMNMLDTVWSLFSVLRKSIRLAVHAWFGEQFKLSKSLGKIYLALDSDQFPWLREAPSHCRQRWGCSVAAGPGPEPVGKAGKQWHLKSRTKVSLSLKSLHGMFLKRRLNMVRILIRRNVCKYTCLSPHYLTLKKGLHFCSGLFLIQFLHI